MVANPKLIKACKGWDSFAKKINEGKFKIPKIIDRYSGETIYASSDYTALACKITDDVAEVQVGGSTGHKAKVDYKERKLEYYDNRSFNNRAMWKILNNIVKLQCKRDYNGVFCKKVTDAKLNKAFKALAIPASMDFRISFCERNNTEVECIDAQEKMFKNMMGKKK